MGFRHFFANFERTYYTEYMYTIPNAAIFLILICYKNVSMGISPFRVRIEKPLEKNSRCRPTAKRWNNLVPIILITFPPFQTSFSILLRVANHFMNLVSFRFYDSLWLVLCATTIRGASFPLHVTSFRRDVLQQYLIHSEPQPKNLWLYRVCLICLATKILLVCVFWFCYV